MTTIKTTIDCRCTRVQGFRPEELKRPQIFSIEVLVEKLEICKGPHANVSPDESGLGSIQTSEPKEGGGDNEGEPEDADRPQAPLKIDNSGGMSMLKMSIDLCQVDLDTKEFEIVCPADEVEEEMLRRYCMEKYVSDSTGSDDNALNPDELRERLSGLEQAKMQPPLTLCDLLLGPPGSKLREEIKPEAVSTSVHDSLSHLTKETAATEADEEAEPEDDPNKPPWERLTHPCQVPLGKGLEGKTEEEIEELITIRQECLKKFKYRPVVQILSDLVKLPRSPEEEITGSMFNRGLSIVFVATPYDVIWSFQRKHLTLDVERDDGDGRVESVGRIDIKLGAKYCEAVLQTNQPVMEPICNYSEGAFPLVDDNGQVIGCAQVYFCLTCFGTSVWHTGLVDPHCMYPMLSEAHGNPEIKHRRTSANVYHRLPQEKVAEMDLARLHAADQSIEDFPCPLSDPRRTPYTRVRGNILGKEDFMYISTVTGQPITKPIKSDDPCARWKPTKSCFLEDYNNEVVEEDKSERGQSQRGGSSSNKSSGEKTPVTSDGDTAEGGEGSSYNTATWRKCEDTCCTRKHYCKFTERFCLD